MLEIVHDLAPGAQLFFATAIDGPGGFARNIRSLREAGCDILVDDFEFDDESPFQDDIIARAVNEVTADGALYVSLAGNSGNLDQETSGTWEGDFADSNQQLPGLTPDSGRIHDFGDARIFNVVTEGVGAGKINLFWADPLGAAQNDYDVFVLNPSGTEVRAAGNTTQNGSQDPYESLGSILPGERIVILLFSGAPRFLHLDTFRGGLSIGTQGRIRGHSCAAKAICVAAVDARTAATWDPAPEWKVEKFSSDGPRRMFFDPDGQSFTPGNWSAAGGTVRRKPDITAADAVETTIAEFNPFIGTSAAAPHAAAVAALLMSHHSADDPNAIRSALLDTALDMQAPGWDENSGAGFVTAYAAAETFSARRRIATATAAPGVGGSEQLDIFIALEATGNENAISFTLEFDASRLEFMEAVTGPDAPLSASFFTNTQDARLGQVGFVFALSPGERVQAGQRRLLQATFQRQSAVRTDLTFAFGDAVLPRIAADVLANQIEATFESSTVAWPATPSPPDILRVLSLTGGRVQLQALGVPGARYVIEVSEDFESWRTITEILSVGETFEYTDNTTDGVPRRFYRTRNAGP